MDMGHGERNDLGMPQEDSRHGHQHGTDNEINDRYGDSCFSEDHVIGSEEWIPDLIPSRSRIRADRMRRRHGTGSWDRVGPIGGSYRMGIMGEKMGERRHRCRHWGESPPPYSEGGDSNDSW